MRIVRRPLENSRTGICRTVNRITETVIAKILSPGERTQVRAGVKHKSVLPFRPQKTKLVETTVLTPALSSEEREKTFAVPLRIRTPGFTGQSAAPESGAKDTRSPDASRLPDALKLRKASGLRRVHRRFLRAPGLA